MGELAGNLPEPMAESGRVLGRLVLEKRRLGWAAGAGLVVVLGVLAATLAAGVVAHNDASQSARQFAAASADISSTLELAIQHEEDLVVSAGAFVASNPDAPNSKFVQWGDSVQWMTRYPEVVSIGHMVLVPASELKAFAARAVINPIGPLSADGAFQTVPPGDRPFYCLPITGLSQDPRPTVPAGRDFCADPVIRSANLGARDSGHSSYDPIQLGAATLLGVMTPVYLGGVPQPTVAARRQTFLGWIGMTVQPDVVLDRALLGHPGIAVTFTHHANSSDAMFHRGTAPAGAQTVVTDLNNGWTVQTLGTVAAGGIFGTGAAVALLLTGSILSLLLAALVFVLGTGRMRALRLVDERTAQLRGAQAQLVETARRAGMAEIATNVLHNVGNVLNSINVSADLTLQKVRSSKSEGLARVVALLNEHTDDLGDFFCDDPRGRTLPVYLDRLTATLALERDSIGTELLRLLKGVDHIKEIVAAQQSLAGVAGTIESVRLSDLIDDALRIGIDVADISVIRDCPADPILDLDRHRVVLVLVNLISNAVRAMKNTADQSRTLTLRTEVSETLGVRITVIDNGEGIPDENLNRIFVHGFTTHPDGHGFGLHSSAIAAKEMGGELTVQENVGAVGAAFTLHIPLEHQVPLDRGLVSV